MALAGQHDAATGGGHCEIMVFGQGCADIIGAIRQAVKAPGAVSVRACLADDGFKVAIHPDQAELRALKALFIVLR